MRATGPRQSFRNQHGTSCRGIKPASDSVHTKARENSPVGTMSLVMSEAPIKTGTLQKPQYSEEKDMQ